MRDLYDDDAFAVLAGAVHGPGWIDFVLACAERFGLPLRSGVELACGPALLSADLAARGVRMTAVDRSASMLAEARRACAERGVDVALVQADLTDHRAEPPVDIVTNLGLNSTHVVDHDAMRRHLRAVADSLRPGGLYLADHELVLHRLPPPIRVEPPWLVYRCGPMMVASGGGVTIRFAEGDVRYDPHRQVFVAQNVVERVRSGVHSRATVPSEGKLWFPLEIRALIEATPGLGIVGWYRDYRLDAPLDGWPLADRFVVVVRRHP